MAASLKKSTFLKGLAVVKLPHSKLSGLYARILGVLAKFPESSAYRINTEQIIRERADIVKNTADISAVEEKIGCGQIEELIVQAENELKLARKITVWKPWEPLISQEPSNQWTWPPHK